MYDAKMKAQNEIVKTLSQIDKNASLSERSKALKQNLKTSELSATKKTQKQTKRKKRDIKAFAIVSIDKQSRYERRYYMRDFHKSEIQTHVRHKTNINIDVACEQCLAFMQAKKRYKTRDFVNHLQSFGPSYSDVIRNAMRKLAKQNKVIIHKISENERTRHKYEYELVS